MEGPWQILHIGGLSIPSYSSWLEELAWEDGIHQKVILQSNSLLFIDYSSEISVDGKEIHIQGSIRRVCVPSMLSIKATWPALLQHWHSKSDKHEIIWQNQPWDLFDDESLEDAHDKVDEGRMHDQGLEDSAHEECGERLLLHQML